MSAWEKYLISQIKSVYLALSPLVRLCLQGPQKRYFDVLKKDAYSKEF